MNKSVIKYGLIAIAIGGFYLYSNFKNNSASDYENGVNVTNKYSTDDIDLNLVLDSTVETLYAYEEKVNAQEEKNEDDAFLGFAQELAVGYNNSTTPIYKNPISVQANQNASLVAYDDANNNQVLDQNEDALFLIEIDGEKNRVIASSRSGAVNEHGFTGTSLLTGYLIGSMLSRQRSAGVNPSSLANKKTVTAKQARQSAKSRAGSGSHSRGK